MKKLNLHKTEEKLLELNLKIFTPNDLKVIFGVSKRAVQGFLNYNIKKGAFVHLRKGLYGLNRNLPNEFVLANRVYFPSYVSLDSALAYYNLIFGSCGIWKRLLKNSVQEFLTGIFHYAKKLQKGEANGFKK